MMRPHLLLCLALFGSANAFGVVSRPQNTYSQTVGSQSWTSSPLFRSETARAVSMGGGASDESVVQRLKAEWKQRLMQVSNWASLLCVVDCTLLPIVTFVLPVLGLVSFSPSQMKWLHVLGHQIALFFVLPVGSLTTVLNFSQHKKWITASLGWCGLVTIWATNAGCGAFPHGHVLHELLHTLHHGVTHRLANVAGCVMLLTSNYWSRKLGHVHGPECSHDHHHSHEHGPNCNHDH